MRILNVFGTRPEAIKMAPVIHALAAADEIECRICVTAQHREMLDGVLAIFDIRADHDLDIMRPNQDLAHITQAVLAGVGTVLEEEKPDRVLVHGDTTTTFAAALASFYQKIPVGHVEAGLRTGDRYAPFPEEINRKLTDGLCNMHFAPTQLAADNLAREGIVGDSVSITGNTVIDALLHAVGMVRGDAELQKSFAAEFPFFFSDKHIILVTGHRRENFGDGFERICQALATLSERDDVEIVYPVHLNPNVQEPVRRLLGQRGNVHLLKPLGYLPFVFLMDRCHLVITDSGGIQEEAPSLGKPVLVMREVTERSEAVEAGTVKLVGTNSDVIVGETLSLLDKPEAYAAMGHSQNPYGDGKAAARIVDEIKRSHGK